MITTRHALAVLIASFAFAACAQSPSPRTGEETRAAEETRPGTDTPPAEQTPGGTGGVGDEAGDGTGGAQDDSTRIAMLEAQARVLARTEGCREGGQCRMAPVGSRPCGGPRTFLPYCAATTDSAALFRKLAELARAEEAFNRERGLASTCELRQPPLPELAGGVCRAAAERTLTDVAPR